MSSRNKRKWKSLTHKVEHLRLEVEDRDEAVKDFEIDFLKELASSIDGSIEEYSQPEVPSNKVSTQVEFASSPAEQLPSANEQVDELPEDIKKIWKSIAAATHPDRTKNDARKTALYLAASDAIKTGSIDEIIRIAIELGIEIPEASAASVVRLESLAVELQKKISQAEGSILWQWGVAPPDIKLKIMEVYISMKKYKKKNS
jgi:hypothetical protein